MLKLVLLFSFFQALVLALHYHADSTFLNLYNNNSGLHSFIRNLSRSYPDASETRKCQQDENLIYLHLGNNKLTQAIIVCNIHARQFITAEICINWAEQYLRESKNNPHLASFGIDLFYLANLNRDAAVIDHKCVRKSMSGMDMNRNFPTQFGFYPRNKQSEIYPGEAPITEPLTQCLSGILQSQKPILFLDLHSGENGGFFYQQGFNSKQDRQILQIVNKQICNNNCRITTLARDGEAINGHIFADVKVRLNMKYSLLLQIYGEENTSDCLAQFNPSTKELKDQVVAQWSAAINLIIKEVTKRQNL